MHEIEILSSLSLITLLHVVKIQYKPLQLSLVVLLLMLMLLLHAGITFIEFFDALTLVAVVVVVAVEFLF